MNAIPCSARITDPKDMRTNVERALRPFVRAMAALAAVLLLASCGKDSSSTEPEIHYLSAPSQSDNKDFSYALGPLTITLRLYAGDYTDGDVAVFEGDRLCATKVLTTDSGEFTLNNDRGCGGFTLRLQYVPASAPCQPGGLYLLSGKVTNPRGGQHEYRAMNLATWDQQGEPVEPWVTPFDAPTLLKQAAQYDRYNHLPGHPLDFDTLGRWTYQVDYRSAVIPPDGCSLRTTVDLTLTPVDESIAPRLYQYVVTESDTGGQLAADVAAITEGAPKVSVTLDQGSWRAVRHLSFVGLDALRDAQALTKITFAQSGNTVSFAEPLRPRMEPLHLHGPHSFEFDITEGYAAAPLATHLARFFSGVTSPLTDLCRPSSIEPLIPVRIGAGLATHLGGHTVVIPLQLVPNYTFRPGFDDQTDCTASPDPGLSCRLAAAIAAAMPPHAPPDPLASYALDVTFGGSPPVLSLRQAVIPLARITE